MSEKNIGIYVHIPFCRSKCPYCDFYSNSDISQSGNYIKAVINSINKFGRELPATADTLYFGGGTPTLLPPEYICDIISAAKDNFKLNGAEITCEANPESGDKNKFLTLAKGGINRISIGLQSADSGELKTLGRLHNAESAKNAVIAAKDAGITNISLDLMLGLPNQTLEKLKKSIDFCAELGVKHISAYILKIEPDSVFGRTPIPFSMPDEDTVCELYLNACRLLEERGFFQYEISNFAVKGFESRHNLKYWNCEEYLGIGAAAHSFINGKRFYFNRDTEDFIHGRQPEQDGNGGNFDEYVMLKLRLTEGICEEEVKTRFSRGFSENMKKNASVLEKTGLVIKNGDRISLTPKGFLVSNEIIIRLLGEKN